MVDGDRGSAEGVPASGPCRAAKRLTIGELGIAGVAERLAGAGLRLGTGPIATCIQSSIPAVADGIALLYAEHFLEESGFADFHVRVERPAGMRRFLRPQVTFQLDGIPPFLPLPGDQGFPILEWGLNWCVSAHCHQYLIMHAGVLERGGRALVLPAASGSGKSTLCAGLTSRGWRLLSDELALLSPVSGELFPLARPISLKNASIEAIRRFAPDAVIGAAVHDTAKGSVAHMKPPSESVRQQKQTTRARWIVRPKFQPGAPARLQPLAKARAFMHLVDSAVNYQYHGRQGFDCLGELVQSCDCYEFTYSDLEDAVRIFGAFTQA